MNADQRKEVLDKRPFLYAMYGLLKFCKNKDYLNRVSNDTPAFYLPSDGNAIIMVNEGMR